MLDLQQRSIFRSVFFDIPEYQCLSLYPAYSRTSNWNWVGRCFNLGCPTAMGVARIFFGGGDTCSKKFSKNSQRIFKKYSNNVRKIFQKIFKTFKNFLTKIAKMHYFRLVFSLFNQAWGQFLRVWTKKAISRKFFTKFSKMFKNFLNKIEKLHYFSSFFTKFKKLCVNFLRVWTKNRIYWKFWENFRNFRKFFLRELRKCII